MLWLRLNICPDYNTLQLCLHMLVYIIIAGLSIVGLEVTLFDAKKEIFLRKLYL